MAEERRRPPPGKSFPFLRKGEGQKAKVNYPVLTKQHARSSVHVLDQDVRRVVSENDGINIHSSEGRRHNGAERNDLAHHTDLGWQTPSARRTVQTADSGFAQDIKLHNELVTSSSSDIDVSSPCSSSIDTANVELRKGDAFRLQQVALGKAVQGPSVSYGKDCTSQEFQNRQHYVRCADVGTTNDVARQNHKALNNDCSQQKGRSTHLNESNNVDGQLESLLREQGSRYRDVESKLIGQLRDVIAHLDLADVKQQIRAKELEEAYMKFQQDVREFESEIEAEKERVARIRRQLERERRIASKDGGERDKAVTEQIEDLTKTIAQKDRQISTLRLRLRKVEEQEESKNKQLEENRKKMERLQKTSETLQRQMAQVRATGARRSQEMAAEIQAARMRKIRQKGSIGLLPSLHKESRKDSSVVNFGQPSSDSQPATQERTRLVSWADKPAPNVSQTLDSSISKGAHEMKLVEEATACFGPCRLFKNGVGDWTKVTTTFCGCDFYEYSNSDVRWFSCDRSTEVYYYGIVGVTVVSSISGCIIRYFNDGQIEIYRLSGEISRFDSITCQRTETMLSANGLRYVEIFDCTGCCVRLEGASRTSQRVRERSSHRGNPVDRYVYNHNNIEPEWIEPDFSARRCPDGSLKMKFVNIMICCLGLEDVGYVKHTTRLEDGIERKRMCVEWGHVARAKQRQTENRKCQELTALNDTV